jgi:hypothetical protein
LRHRSGLSGGAGVEEVDRRIEHYGEASCEEFYETIFVA